MSEWIAVPEFVAVCPYCGSSLSCQIDGEIKENERWLVDHITTECHSEPNIDSKEWEFWFKHHSYMPYVYQLPVDMQIIEWLNHHRRKSVSEVEFLYEVYRENSGKREAIGKTPYMAWRRFYEDVNSFADNLTEFRKSMQFRGYRCRKTNQPAPEVKG